VLTEGKNLLRNKQEQKEWLRKSTHKGLHDNVQLGGNLSPEVAASPHRDGCTGGRERSGTFREWGRGFSLRIHPCKNGANVERGRESLLIGRSCAGLAAGDR